jgi:hypothetical protein
MDSGFDDWVYWHLFTITIYYNSSHIELILNDVCLTNFYEESLTASNQIRVRVMLRPRSVGQSVLVSSTHLGLTTRFLLLSDSCGFVTVGRPLGRENGSAVYNCCWSSPAQSFLGPSPAGLVTIIYCLKFETPPTWRVRSPYLYPPGTGWSSYTPRHWVPFSTASNARIDSLL